MANSGAQLTRESFRASEALVKKLVDGVAETVVGHSAAVELLLAAVLCEGHVLIEDVPGTGKTLLAKTLAVTLGLTFRRIQFTPDLLPSDVTGSSVFNQRTAEFEFRAGPLFGQIVLADEVNRATPRTQSALLEAMEERQVTADGVSMALPRPFLVVATQNPIELEGTFPLPEAQLDRFLFQLRLGYPDLAAERAIVLRNANAAGSPGTRTPTRMTLAELQQLQQLSAAVHVAEDVHDYMLAVVRTTRQWPALALGASPRASIALYRAARALACIRGRDYVVPDDVKYLAPAVLSHRLGLSQEARMTAQSGGAIVTKVLERVPVPVERALEPPSTHA
jgi:MoxR-like ATPase